MHYYYYYFFFKKRKTLEFHTCQITLHFYSVIFIIYVLQGVINFFRHLKA